MKFSNLNYSQKTLTYFIEFKNNKNMKHTLTTLVSVKYDGVLAYKPICEGRSDKTDGHSL